LKEALRDPGRFRDEVLATVQDEQDALAAEMRGQFRYRILCPDGKTKGRRDR
jgi:hypothetical protein